MNSVPAADKLRIVQALRLYIRHFPTRNRPISVTRRQAAQLLKFGHLETSGGPDVPGGSRLWFEGRELIIYKEAQREATP